jgi:hypothetical protein
MSELPKFGDYKEGRFPHVLDLMGEAAVWEHDDGTLEDGRILFNYPTQNNDIGEADYQPNTPSAEYYKDTFIGLKELMDSGIQQYLIIRGERYFITSVLTLYDGETYVAHLTKDE